MENRYNHIFNNGIKFGGLLGAIFIFLSLIYYIADFNMVNVMFGLVNFILVIAIYIIFFRWANTELRTKNLNGWLTYPEGLLHTFIIGMIAAIIQAAYNYLFYTFFDPEYLTKMGEKVMEMLENNPNLPAQALEEAERKIAEMTPAKSALQGLYYSMAMSFIFALIVSAFTKKKRDIFDETGLQTPEEQQ
ncbi:MAG: hypothetical protein PWR20_2295 [Bacteroidales bacterium]|jgi:hypothetical protein|nr:hypothetical protein [Bacteroidales bacterium]NLH51648.1 DUF4199 domain-containing protein [Bacteroidales bacterium]